MLVQSVGVARITTAKNYFKTPKSGKQKSEIDSENFEITFNTPIIGTIAPDAFSISQIYFIHA